VFDEIRTRGGAATSSLAALLPLAFEAANAVADEATARLEAAGGAVSCAPGCGACCRHLVPVSLVEAVGIADTIAAMEPARRAVIEARFAEAERKLIGSRLLDPASPVGTRRLVAHAGHSTDDPLDRLTRAYFAQQIPCPFLEQESCSIHEARPTACRQHLVSTPSARCRLPFDEPAVETIDIAARVGPALMWAAHEAAALPPVMVPLILAPEWAATARAAVEAPHDGAALRARFADAIDRMVETGRPAPERDLAPPSATAGDATPSSAERVATVALTIRERRLELKVLVSEGPTSPRALLPMARALASAAADIAIEDAAAAGKPLSCRAGCGACCRSLVPIAEAEAHQLAALVRAMPEPRQSTIRARFAAAIPRLEAAGLLTMLREMAGSGIDKQYGWEYFRQGIPCPFLEDESCSIYEDRPLICRSYLVSSPAERCATPDTSEIQEINLPVVDPLRAFVRGVRNLRQTEPIVWVPMILALEWSDANPEPAPTRSGPELLGAVLRQLTAG
jgi:Fe-S-cluster containining protein